jgi:shikimate dehydrogenase
LHCFAPLCFQKKKQKIHIFVPSNHTAFQKQMYLFGLLGYPLSHSFSKRYFTEKFEREGIKDCRYDLYAIEKIELLTDILQQNRDIIGLNVTIPYKQAVIPFLDAIDETAAEAGAVNSIKIENGTLTGYNTDIIGFEESLLPWLNPTKRLKALVLGNGGAAKAVFYVLKKHNIPYKIVTRSPKNDEIGYNSLDKKLINAHRLIINTTPLGMSPNIDTCPAIPYQYLTQKHFLYDLVYNPEQTLFLTKGMQQGAATKNGIEMLHSQAINAWKIWTKDINLLNPPSK